MLIFNINFNTQELPVKEIIEYAEEKGLTHDIVKEYIIMLLAQDDNILSRMCEEKVIPGDSLREAALKDTEQLMKSIASAPEFLKSYIPSVKRRLAFNEYQQSLKSILSADTSEKTLDRLILHYLTFGGGEISKYIAFKWDGGNGLKGIEKPDDISLNQLFCLDRQKQTLIDNTTMFLRDFPANNVLLYGNSGCGKSSMVKALLNKYYNDGLRLAQIAKDDLAELPDLIDIIKKKIFKYIIFIDDLSFEDNDYRYKTLKTILEGGVEKQPKNILIYATSNRIHLVNEKWTERQGEDVHINDTRNEKLSLSERFGIRVSFLSPDQNEYLEIVKGVLSRKNIPATSEIKAAAVRWALLYNGLSGRTAVQFANAVFSQ